MSVYKEGYYIVGQLENLQHQLYQDAADYGIETKKGDKVWGMCQQLADWYGEEETRKVEEWDGGKSVSIQITLMDEWAVSDERKTVKEATEVFTLHYCTFPKNDRDYKGFDGFFTLESHNSHPLMDFFTKV